MEIIVVSDTNILIDLIEAGVLEHFFLLPMKVHTTDIVISEVTVPEQKAQVRTLVQTRCLTVKAFTPDEMLRLIDFVNSRRITYHNSFDKFSYKNKSMIYDSKILYISSLHELFCFSFVAWPFP